MFEGRYKAVVIESDSGKYFETVSTYIHLNPARAGLISAERGGLEQYKWSSYPWYAEEVGSGLKIQESPIDVDLLAPKGTA